MSQKDPSPDQQASQGAASEATDGPNGEAASPSRNGASRGRSVPRPRSGPKKSKRAKSPVQREGTRIDRGAPRHQARILAMQSLFEHDMTGHDLEEILARLSGEEGEDVPPPVRDHTLRLARGVNARVAEVDPYIADAATAFPIPQLASIDRSVLRLAVYELLFERDTPYKVVINEAVEIAKRFGGPSSGRFTNGVLGTIVDRIPSASSLPAELASPSSPEPDTPA